MSTLKEKFITLKEASEISGYAPDYIGQLIRSGKIDGKQVFSNVAWVTTEEAIRRYAERAKNGGAVSGRAHRAPFSFSAFAKGALGARLYKVGIYTLIGLGVIFGLVLFYILSINIEHFLQERANKKAEERVTDIPLPGPEDPHIPL